MLAYLAKFRVLLAILSASIVVTAIATGGNWGSSHLPLVFSFTLAYGICLGLPLYIFLPDTLRLRWHIAVISGFMIGALPLFLIGMNANLNGNSSVGGVDHVVNGVRTKDGWISFLGSAVYAGALGAIGGITAWSVWMYFRRKFPTHWEK